MIAITMDLDWASPQQVDRALETLTEIGVDKVTTFVPPYANKMDQDDVLHVLRTWLGRVGEKNIGIHPVPYRDGFVNEPLSTNKAIDMAMEVVPKADFYRCHGLYDSHWLQKEMKDRGFKFCSNSCQWFAKPPVTTRNALGMWDIPIWWEDSIEFRGWNTLQRGKDEPWLNVFVSGAMHWDKIVINLHPQYRTQWAKPIAALMKHKPPLAWLREAVPNE